MSGATNIGEFVLCVDTWLAQFNEQAEEAFQSLVLDVFSRIALRTPVKTGHARWNWQVGINRSTNTELKGTDKIGDKTISRNQDRINRLVLGDTAHIYNNVSYITLLEGLEGPPTSSQAPNGMVAVTLAEVKQGLNL